MPPPRTVHIERVPEDLMSQKLSHENTDFYTRLKYMALYNYNKLPDALAFAKQCGEDLDPPEGFLTFFADEPYLVPEAILELSFRRLANCRVELWTPEGALYLLDALTDEWRAGPERYIADSVPAEMRAKAHSAASQAYFLQWGMYTPEFYQEDYLMWLRPRDSELAQYEERHVLLSKATQHANSSAALGLVSQHVVQVGHVFQDMGVEAGVDLLRGHGFEPLRQAMQEYDEWKREQEAMRKEKREKDEKAYICASPTCKIEGMHKSVLRACGGRCAPENKPHYCSKECQKRDWPRHKVVCREMAASLRAPLPTPSVPQSKDDLNEGLPVNTFPCTPGPAHCFELFGDNLGDQIRVVSTTLLPAELRKLRQNILDARKASESV